MQRRSRQQLTMKEEPIILLCVFHQKLDLLELDQTRDLAGTRSRSTLTAYNVVPGGLELGVAWIVVVDKNHNITSRVFVGISYNEGKSQ